MPGIYRAAEDTESAGRAGGVFFLSIYPTWNGRHSRRFFLCIYFFFFYSCISGSGFGVWACLGNVDSRHIPIQYMSLLH